MGCKGNFDVPTAPCKAPKGNLKRQLNALIKMKWIEKREKDFVLAARDFGYDVFISLGMDDEPSTRDRRIDKLKIEITKSKYK